MNSKLVVGALGVLGVIASYWKFLQWIDIHGLHLIEPWREAMTSSLFSAGLHWDLFFSLGIILTMAITDRRRLGLGWTAAVVFAGCVLGVCAAMAVYWARVGPVTARQAD